MLDHSLAGSFSNSTMNESSKFQLSIIRFCESNAKSMTASTSSSPVAWTAAAGYERRRRGGADRRTDGRSPCLLGPNKFVRKTPAANKKRRWRREGGAMGLLKSHQCHSDQRGTLCQPSVRQLKKSSSGVGGNVCST